MTEAAAVTEADVLAYLQKTAPEIAALIDKDATVGDVHATTAIGNGENKGKPKAKPFAALIAEATGKKPATEEETTKAWSLPITVLKAQPEQQMIFGWASMSELDGEIITDKQGDQITPDELEKAAYNFVLAQQETDARKVAKFLKEIDEELLKRFEATTVYKRGGLGDMHTEVGKGRLVESFVFTAEKQDILKIDLGLVGWWTGFKVDSPELWAAHKRGERPEFSIGGRAARMPV